LTGDYVWSTARSEVGFRPLRDIRAAFLPQAAEGTILNERDALYRLGQRVSETYARFIGRKGAMYPLSLSVRPG
jgi:hypothetical protein